MASVLYVINTFSRLSVCSTVNPRNISTCMNPLCFQVTNVLLGEPLKKKKKIDPTIVRAREERRKRKLEKQIRRLEKLAQQLKPIFEVDISSELMEQIEDRSRNLAPLSPQETERRALLEKEWSRYKLDQWKRDINTIESILHSQKIALKELKAVSKQLYEEAIQFDETFLPYSALGPVNTPPIENYDSPDGAYIETTLKYVDET
ncbi:PREDICTED: 39S ribosomal protein L40, mitochondrial [Dufourea novaeangliae]|uniref:39S ribosomal protein L40, mitochondrial n=1 Tax=Dufourea novaeangliae TaxID=178035 RepID=UPI000767D7C1|nr:PREDICTED: 39S ribosomal protein L40, mitochondrial [Dufourea novaeangliae]XP_015440222.1 PREDICTED: 39S ribosomal protein L40, mitochondrial [Dufourea novaeangliae]